WPQPRSEPEQAVLLPEASLGTDEEGSRRPPRPPPRPPRPPRSRPRSSKLRPPPRSSKPRSSKPPPPPRPPPPPPPPPRRGPPPPPPPCRAWASLTRMLRPSSCAPSSSFIAVSASASFSYVTKPKPLERPVSRSRMTLASATGPNCWKASKSDASSVAHASPPTKSFLDNSRLVAPPKRSLGGFVEGPPAEIGPRQDCFGHDVNGIASATAVPALRARQDRHWSPLRAPPGDFGV